ncbi:hypothetical protein [Spirosoma arcticum]
MKHALWIIALIGVTLLGDRLGGALLRHVVDDSQFRYSRLYNGRAGADIVFMGNSRGLSFYEPHVRQLTGRTSFNLSYNAMPMDLGYTLFQDYLRRNPAPSTLIIEVSMCNRLNKELVVSFGCYAPYSPELTRLINAYDRKMGVAGQVVNLVRYNSEVFQRALYHLKRSDENWIVNRTISKTMINTIGSVKPHNLKVASNDILQSLVKTVKLAQSKGIRVHLVVNPYQPDFVAKLAHLESWKAQISNATGLPITDYSNAVQGNEQFADYQHLNVKGSYQLISLLKKEAILD